MSGLSGLGLGFGGGETPGGTGAAPDAGGLSPMDAGKQLLGGEEESPFDDVKKKAKGALSVDNIGNVEAQTRAAADSVGNADRAVAEQVGSAFKGMTGIALTGAKNLAGDGAGSLVGGAPPPAGKLEEALGGGISKLMSFAAPGVPVKEALQIAKQK